MATFSGNAGVADASFGGTAMTNVRSWSLDINATVAQGAHSDSSQWVEAYPGVRSWTATVEIFQNDSPINPVDVFETGSLILTDGSNNTYTGNAVVSNVTYNDDVEGGELVNASVTFIGNGVMTIAEVAGP